jgi:colanic acid/amylovoran biosynthesis glycosyltransferase
VELDCYGQGSLGSAMRTIAARHKDHIRIHDTIPFPDLVLKSREADLFVCCHIQSDPSCTYLETMGSGVPIVGYSNRMWSAMSKESGAGMVSRRNTPNSLADAIASYCRSPSQLNEASMKARTFAIEHCFEKEFSKRTDAINKAVGTSASPLLRS